MIGLRLRAWCGAAALWTLFAAPSAADAQKSQSITLIDLSADGAVEKEVAYDARRALRLDRNLRYRDPDESLHVGGEVADAGNIRSGRSFLKAARRAIDDKNWADAFDQLESATTAYLSSFALATSEDAIEEVLYLQAAVLLKLGDVSRATKAMERAVEFHAGFEFDFSPFGAEAQALHAKVKERVAARPTVTYEVRTSSPNAEVWANGKFVGLTPTFVEGPAGPQFVRVSKNGWARVGRMQEVTKPDQVLTFELTPARRQPAWDSLRARLGEIFEGAVEPADFSAAQGLLGSNLALVVRVTGTREKLLVQMALANLAGRQVIKRVQRELSWMRRDKKAIQAMVAETLASPDIPLGGDAPEVRTERVWHKWWFWGLVGGVVAGSVTAAILLNEEEPTGPKYAPGTGGLVLKF